MATHSNSSPAEDGLERGTSRRGWPRDTSYSTKAVRDITYKVIPFCSFCLIVFSIGAILTSTIAFDKPIPRQGTIVISSILLSFFVLFLIGLMYLYFRKFWPRVSKSRSRQTSYSDGHSGGHSRNIPRRSERPSGPGLTSHTVSRDSRGGAITSGVLRNPAPSPKTYKNKTKEDQEVAKGQNVVYELAGSSQQQDYHPAQQYKQQTDEISRLRPSNRVQEDAIGADQLLSGGEHNGSIPINMESKLYQEQTSSGPDIRNIHKGRLASPLAGDLGWSSSAMDKRSHAADKRKHAWTPMQLNLHRGDMHRPEISRQAPSINIQMYEPSPLSSPGSVGTGPRQFQSPVLGAPARGSAATDSLIENDIPGKRPIGPRPMDSRFLVHLKAGSEGKLSTMNPAISSQGYNPLKSEQAEIRPSYQSDNDAHLRTKRIPLNIAGSSNGSHRDFGTRSPTLQPRTFPASPLPNQTYPRYLAAAPQPLSLLNQNRYYMSHTYTAYNPRKIKPQLRQIYHGSPIYEVEEEVREVPTIPAQVLGRERTERPNGGDQHRPRVPQRGSSRKFKKKIPNISRSLSLRLKRKNPTLNPNKNNDENWRRSR
ncbi:hypothetical protein F4803DRAFT_575370 [Xylaria telfairii]|nr:hypothetical protein F4803DRAFT_575370 [Xylaria telfairii]